VGIRRDDRRVLRHQAAAGEALQNEALHVRFSADVGVTLSARNLGKRLVDDLAQRAGGAAMTGKLRGAPHRLETLDEVGRRNDLDAHPAH